MQLPPSSPHQPIDLSDLLAVALVRRVLMELGYHLDPDQVGRHQEIGPIEMWIRERRADLDGEAPITILRTQGGEDRVREILRQILSRSPSR